MREPQNFVRIYSNGLARKLLREGHTLLDVERNDKDPERANFIFSDPDQAIRKSIYAKRDR